MATSPVPAHAGTRRSVRPRLALWLGLAGLTFYVTLGAVMAATLDHPFTQPMDDAWRSLVGAATLEEASGPLPMFFQHFGELAGAVVYALVVPIVLFSIRRWRTGLFWLATMLFANGLVSQAGKHLVDRERPAADEAAGLVGPLFATDHGSFPSGHSVTMGAFVVAVAALLPAIYRRWWWIAGAVLAVGMIWQRTLINAHWLSDTIAGIVAGASAAALLWWAFAPLLDRDRGRAVRHRASRSEPRQGASEPAESTAS